MHCCEAKLDFLSNTILKMTTLAVVAIAATLFTDAGSVLTPACAGLDVAALRSHLSGDALIPGDAEYVTDVPNHYHITVQPPAAARCTPTPISHHRLSRW